MVGVRTYGAIAVRPNSDQHDWCCSCDDEVEEPLRRGRQTHIRPPQPARGNLRDIDPAHRTPTKLEERRKKIHHDQRHISSTTNRRARDRRIEAHVETQVEHGNEHCGSRPDERAFAAQGVGEEDKEEAAGDHFDDAVDAGGEEGGGVAGYAEVVEDFWGVVVYGVRAGHLGELSVH